MRCIFDISHRRRAGDSGNGLRYAIRAESGRDMRTGQHVRHRSQETRIRRRGADGTADPEFLAADLLSQAEHDEMAMAILVTPDRALAEKTSKAVSRRLADLPKAAIAGKSIEKFGTIITASNLRECAEISDEIAPEHLELCVSDPESLLPLVHNAGAVFMGHWSPEPLGDYYAGTNHVLPNGGTARYFSALGVSNFVKRISLIKYDRDALLGCADDIIALAESEGLEAHARSIRVRKESVK